MFKIQPYKNVVNKAAAVSSPEILSFLLQLNPLEKYPGDKVVSYLSVTSVFYQLNVFISTLFSTADTNECTRLLNFR